MYRRKSFLLLLFPLHLNVPQAFERSEQQVRPRAVDFSGKYMDRGLQEQREMLQGEKLWAPAPSGPWRKRMRMSTGRQVKRQRARTGDRQSATTSNPSYLIQWVKCNVVSHVAVEANCGLRCSNVGRTSSSLAFTLARKISMRRVSGPLHT